MGKEFNFSMLGNTESHSAKKHIENIECFFSVDRCKEADAVFIYGDSQEKQKQIESLAKVIEKSNVKIIVLESVIDMPIATVANLSYIGATNGIEIAIYNPFTVVTNIKRSIDKIVKGGIEKLMFSFRNDVSFGDGMALLTVANPFVSDGEVKASKYSNGINRKEDMLDVCKMINNNDFKFISTNGCVDMFAIKSNSHIFSAASPKTGLVAMVDENCNAVACEIIDGKEIPLTSKVGSMERFYSGIKRFLSLEKEGRTNNIIERMGCDIDSAIKSNATIDRLLISNYIKNSENVQDEEYNIVDWVLKNG